MMLSDNFKHWIAVLDLKTCYDCSNMHGKIYYFNERVEVAPPIHEYCRCLIEIMNAIVAGNATISGVNGADWWLKNIGELPENYITDRDARAAGWRSGRNLSDYVSGKMLTMGTYHNYNNHLPQVPGRKWYEADINYVSGRRNGHRIVWSNDGLIFVTFDHYLTFIEVV